jgi:hypothetical protein
MAALAVDLVRPELFGTVTFRPVIGRGTFTEVGIGGAQRGLARYYGGIVKWNPGARMFVALEAHKDRVAPHAHYLLGGLEAGVAAAVEAGRRAGRAAGRTSVGTPRGPLFAVAAATDYIWRWWFDMYGMARVEGVDAAQACGLYVGKYANKELGPFKLWPASLKAVTRTVDSALASAGAGSKEVPCAPEHSQLDTAPRTFT